MKTHVKYNITVKVGSYEKDGTTKGKYQTVGKVMEKDDKSRFIYIDPFFNFGAVNRAYINKDGITIVSDSVMCGLYEPKENQQQRSTSEEE